MNESEELTPRQRRFVDLYAGNATEAARQAGYTGSDDVLGKTGFDLLRNPKVARAIKERERKVLGPKIATREDRQSFWSHVMNDPKAEMWHRLKASELLGRSQADFTENVKVEGKDNLFELVKEARERARKAGVPPVIVSNGHTNEPYH